MFSIIKYLICLIVFGLALGVFRTWQLEHSDDQTRFVAGGVANLPDGLYAGSVGSRQTSWLGKKFDKLSMTGINLFKTETGTTTEEYPFKTSVGKGTRDKDIEVIKIDYNIAGNPFWLRLILDEIVEVSSGQYLGKLQLRVIPSLPFTLMYFELKKSALE